jgi:hypothetical protein
MKLPRLRWTVPQMIAVALLVGAGAAAGRWMTFSQWAHYHRDRAYECGCVRLDPTRLARTGRCLIAYHSMMAALNAIFAGMYGQPPVNCGVPILDPIPGESAP